jgi:hypothetical protein
LLSEFLEVLLSVIQPLASISATYVTANTLQSQMHAHAAQAAYLRSLFDPELIEQELKHNVFDPSGMFRLIGDTLKSHCAPMRDRAVELMMDLAGSCAPGRSGDKAEVVKVFRMCLDVLELMKLVSSTALGFHEILTCCAGCCEPPTSDSAPVLNEGVGSI